MAGVDEPGQANVRRLMGSVRAIYSRSAGPSLSAPGERRAPKPQAFDLASTLELQQKTYSTKPAMLALLQTWLNAAEQHQLSAHRADYVHVLRHAIEVVSEALTPADGIQLLRETEPNVHFVIAMLQEATAKLELKHDESVRLTFLRESRRWKWRYVDQAGEEVSSAPTTFAAYLDCFVDAKRHAYKGRLFCVFDGGKRGRTS